MVARELTSPNHPLHKVFKKWCEKKEPTLRQARKFLSICPPCYKNIKAA